MKKRLKGLGAILILALVLSYPSNDATANHDTGHIIVRVDDDGFNGINGDFTIEVEQGQLVELTFEWAHRVYPGEEHIIVLEGYKLETDKINAQHRNGTIKFIADKPGIFTFKCDLDCDVHEHLQRGHLKVKSSGTGSAGTVARTPSKLVLTPSNWTTKGQNVLLTAVLKDNQGNPIPKAEVRFYADAEFAGTKGKMEIGIAKTDANGVAFLDYRPVLDAPKQSLTAQFEGMGVYAESAMSIDLQESASSPAYTVAPVGLDDIRRAAPIMLVGVVLAVWTTYAFVLSQVFGIFHVRTRR